MKKIAFIAFASMFFAFTMPNLPQIVKALNSGDADALSAFFDNKVEISILEKEGVFNKAAATDILRNFFKTHRTGSFTMIHRGSSKGKDSKYIIGNLAKGNTTYRVYVFIKIQEKRSVIQELRIEEE